MRVERKGQVKPLTPRLQEFLEKGLSGRVLDDPQSSQDMRPDYLCLNGLLVVELKTLEEDGSARLDTLLDEWRKRDDWPFFLGSAPIEAVIKNMRDPETLRAQFQERMSRAFLNHLKKANQQLKAFVAEHPRRNRVRMLILVNENHALYEPGSVIQALHRAFNRVDNGRQRFKNVDAVLYLTEKHVIFEGGVPTLPVVVVQGHAVDDNPWKELVIDRVVDGWGRWGGRKILHRDGGYMRFDTIEDVPELAPRDERWRLNYRRNPYLSQLSDTDLRNCFDEVMVLHYLAFYQDSPAKPPREVTLQNFERSTHVSYEMNQRGIPQTIFRIEAPRLASAARRMQLGDEVIRWFESFREQQ
jgi:hypothetical protein